MSLKFTEQNRRILARRWKYCKETKRSKPETILSVNIFSVPDMLSTDVINTHNVTKDEQQQYIDFATEHNAKTEQDSKKRTARRIEVDLKGFVDVFTSVDALSELTLDDLENLSEHANTLKKLITKEKSKRKRQAVKAVKSL
jgi:hypothetical protein